MAPSRGGAGAALLALLAAVLVCLLQTTTTVQAATTLQTPGDTFEAAFEVSWTPRREGPRGRQSTRPCPGLWALAPLQVVLICISLCRICTGSDGGWAVTKRARDTQHFGVPMNVGLSEERDLAET